MKNLMKNPTPLWASTIPAQRRAFTLMELLVVISIISLLISLLLPALGLAVEAGRNTVCKNNQRQFGWGVQSYIDTNKEIIYPVTVGQWYWIGDEPWGAFSSYSGPTFAPYVNYAFGMPQLGLKGRQYLLYCPSISAQFPGACASNYGYGGVPLAGAGMTDGCLGYGMNQDMQFHFNPGTNVIATSNYKLCDFGADLTKTIVLADSLNSNLFVVTTGANALSYPFGAGAFRHSNSTNALFLDGHVSAKAPSDVALGVWPHYAPYDGFVSSIHDSQ